MTKFKGTKTEIIRKAKIELTPAIVKFIEQCNKKKHSDSYLISVLHKVQDHFGYLAKEKMEAIAYLMNIPTSRISGVATFYHLFKLKPRGKFLISVCLGTACHVKGAEKILEKLEEELGIRVGETTKNGQFTLETARCLGTCALAPVIKIGEDIHPKVTPSQISKILESYSKK